MALELCLDMWVGVCCAVNGVPLLLVIAVESSFPSQSFGSTVLGVGGRLHGIENFVVLE